ncbi:hypothetical protein GOP47_0008615 [Adiantum capillus-veneris]|uniref:BHLH domain-containing protein n=1 Tax=Adiantum capillus-veneris TaxID=13818 RepID=A0A9D4UZB4_ADICA|nr:hypothetical protein GOP47_0008615 [Adiantum capillus-veneris]
MATMPSLQQALKSLCSKTGWCYAVFWKLKRRSRMMLTWEDGYCDYSRSSSDACSSSSNSLRTDIGGNPLDQGGSGDLEGQIGLAVARMSYYVCSMGEGIIGRVAFTGKYQWVFHDGENLLEAASGGNLNNYSSSEKNPDGWQNQFAAGIKTIAVIAVPQGVVQLGSTKLIMEDLKWIDHVKSVFSALQTAPSTPKPELVLEGQGARSAYTNKPPFFYPPNPSTITKKPIAAEHSHPLLRNIEDAVHWQKLGTHATPVAAAKLQGLQSIGGPMSGAEELQFQQSVKVVAEPQCIKHSSAALGPQTNPVGANVPHIDVASIVSKSMLPCDNLKSHVLDDRSSGKHKDSTWTSLAAEGISSGLHTDPKRDHAVTTRGGSLVDKFCARMQEDHPFKKTLTMCSTPDTKQEEGFPNGFFSAGLQHLICLNTSDTAFKSAGLSSVASKVVNKEHFVNKDYHTAAFNVASQFPAKLFVAPTKDHGYGNTGFNSKHDGSKHGSHYSEREANLHNNAGQSDVNTLDELENFLASFCKEETGTWDSSFAIGDELSQALGPAFWKGGVAEVPNLGGGQKSEELALKPAENASMPPSEMVTDWGTKLVSENPYERLGPLESKPEPLLDAIVGGASTNRSSNTEASFTAHNAFSNVTCGLPSLHITQETEPASSSSISGKIMQTLPQHDIRYHGNSNGVLRNLQSLQNLCVSSDTQTNVSVHSWTDEGQSFKSDDTQRVLSQSKRSEELSKSSKKRSRSGESARPRPKDRQQIQDRVRELRDIVPNGSKCSIDALLEKTIKHMLFLHSVTLHADQLKNTGELKEDPDSGATWALDLGSQEKRYPIVVKDLSQPRQMLVEMMCEESGLFLEMADIIRNLGLTILRGSLESHGDKYWARFIVEANRDIQRVDVLVPLIQRLHLDNNSSSSSMTMARCLL